MRFVLLSVFISSSLLFGNACNAGPKTDAASPDSYVGNWKVMNPQLGTYFMTLNPDGSGNSTRSGGELGRWQQKSDHIELEWTPKNLSLYFDSGNSAPQQNPSVPANESSIAEKVDKIPQ